MDPSIYTIIPFTPPSGLPQESKLVTYMNRSPSTPTRSLNQAMNNLSLESSPIADRKPPMIGEFVPANYYSPTNILADTPENSPPAVMLNAVTMPMQVQMPMPMTISMTMPMTNITMAMTNTQVHQENVGGTTYFYATNDGVNPAAGLNPAAMGPECLGVVASPYATQMYAHPVASLMGDMSDMGHQGLAQTFYLPDTIRTEIYERNAVVNLQPDPRQCPELPKNVEMYTDLVALEPITPHSIASSFRATHRQTGLLYALRRLHGYSGTACKRLDAWKQVDHPNIVRLHEHFFTKAFGDHSMILVFDFHPGCSTMLSTYLMINGPNPDAPVYHDPFSNDPDAPRPYTHQKNAMLRAIASGSLLPEAVLWSLLVQMTSAMRAIHANGLSCRTLDSSKVVMNGCRLRFAWCGVADALNLQNVDLVQAQQEDLAALGRVAMSLSCRTIHCDNLAASLEMISCSYSVDYKNLLMYLLPSTGPCSVAELMPLIGARFYTQVEALERRADAFEDQLAHEIDNGRLLRILIKLGIINERPELNMDSTWSETGDRYMLKLFRDYLFHSVTADGKPWLDQAHLVHCLNQLDGGTQAKVELMSHDEQSVLVVSYSELKHCLDQAYDQVMQAASPSQP